MKKVNKNHFRQGDVGIARINDTKDLEIKGNIEPKNNLNITQKIVEVSDLIEFAIKYGYGAEARNISIGEYALASRYGNRYIIEAYKNNRIIVDEVIDTYSELKGKMLDIADWYDWKPGVN